MNKQKITICILAALALLIILAGCGRDSVKTSTSSSRLHMDTVVRITASARSESEAERAIEAGFTKIKSIEKLMDRHNPSSALSKINSNSGSWVQSDRDIIEAIETSKQFSRQTGGAFDISIAPVIDLWAGAAEKGQKPSPEKLSMAKSLVDYRKIKTDRRKGRVKLAESGMKLDLGAIAKGYALDRAKEAMKKAGAAGGLINAGGDILCFGKNASAGGWKIGVRSPEANGQNDIECILEINSGAIATSGDYLRFYEIEGIKTSHIINASTGKGSLLFKSATVFADNAADADALATSLSLLGRDQGLKLIESIEGAECFAIASKGEERIKSSGWDKLILQRYSQEEH
ncbi:Thiamine biosynthesis lipoprotein ApbE precursor [Sedimentisphaera cyanobacteriorum]|uniref:FAD:protein FMN transferase n=1 Tax=Sedimentisphaera cyanobacteriorum TaxID=1940790 RepID=A0A1Q2HQZ7_9BACT|nr:FAD:protein FMN transferase [Sedimentisphaera cyanobacteriorum]AQQ09889.1 Thiamine biosynthesis lipoprotein ApbE precursor [Sedimentisphaera cyanobacteriorum]